MNAEQSWIDTLRKFQHIRNEGKCPFCKKHMGVKPKFRDKLSEREYEISGLCQRCQDDMFPDFSDAEHGLRDHKGE